ncbi:MAG TPA: rRNA maturation RNase YbeY [Thermoanaerobaculales bacterium]|nr:rRNA maturation RNase YbeY [Thermoanaerobaculales bacterium]HPA79590.1 rRNA maturation RNase YbeY [Thermoanaerobaculales bacterium]HQL29231.1 rRNA maturation RNase YbeY [Thermoanaerobaculales bacterium]HQN97393.1 rRNA maturation RNase YbeY [Thermoanaerobaculales bacterium]HQP42625.1 rRNA maturation RNase YbeY [Thermoanaerobaculales bacterium]
MTRVHFRWDRRPSQPAAEALRRVVVEAVRRARGPACEVHVVLTGDDELRRLNRTYRNLDRPTDVLSFADGDTLPTGTVLLGEIVVSLDAARRQGADFGHGELRELEELVLHGTLHLLGHDHEQDGGEMEAIELDLREEILK